MRQAYALLPHIKITDLLLEVDRWTGFSRHFTHLKTGQPCEDPLLAYDLNDQRCNNLCDSKVNKV